MSFFHERFLHKCRRGIHKHPFCKLPIMMFYYIVMVFYMPFFLLFHNLIKVTGMVLALLLYILSCSFCAPFLNIAQAAFMTSVETIEETEVLEDEYTGESAENVYFAGDPATLTDEEVDHLTVDDASMAKEAGGYSMDEILSNAEYSVSATVATQNYGFHKGDWNLILVNKQHPIPEDYTFTLGNITGYLKCDERIIPDLMDMLKQAKNDGISLEICSPYRTHVHQVELFQKKINRFMNKGYSYLEAYRLSSQAVTVPGSSEHEIGLALDIYAPDYKQLNAGFGDTEEGKWLAEHCAEYGFILRYPLGKEEITGIEFEPWHFRYVGKAAAKIITENEITLEEFVLIYDL
ncbi:MAG: M15 family metallopeptidase [Lachnospiraceae bacterium]|nr:M15 family metallopeptidase [Lachnospiraceae bacterium]